jgi:Protein of unknown function (DUF4232)
MVRLSLALGAAALLVACGAVHPLTASTSPVPSNGSVVPWLPLAADLTPLSVPSPQAVPVPAGTPACTLAELESAFVGSNGAGGHVLTSFEFATRGSTACQLDGTPNITLLDASGHELGFKNRAPFFPDEVSGPALVEPGAAPAPYEGFKYGQVGLTIDWISQPEFCPGDGGVKVAKVRIGIAGVGTLTIGIPDEPAGYRCQGVGVGALADPPIQDNAPPEPPAPDASIAAPSKVKAGDQLRFVVTLSNSTKLPIDLRTHCPNYEEELFFNIQAGSPPLGGKHFYRLNCEAAGILMPGKPMAFAMILQVPADATRGIYTLVFNIGSSNAMTKFATQATVAIA